MISFIILSIFSFAQNKSDLDALVICQNGNIVRTIEVSWQKEDQACVTEYTKVNISNEVGRANNKAFCHKFLKNIKENLEAAGWKCRDVSSKTNELFSE